MLDITEAIVGDIIASPDGGTVRRVVEIGLTPLGKAPGYRLEYLTVSDRAQPALNNPAGWHIASKLAQYHYRHAYAHEIERAIELGVVTHEQMADLMERGRVKQLLLALPALTAGADCHG